MLKVILGLLIGGGLGYFGGFYYTETIYNEKLKVISTEKETVSQELTTCKEQTEKLQADFQKVDAELKLNETRECYVTAASLPAPEFVPADLAALQSDESGYITLNWTSVKGAKKYIVKVEGEDGTIVSTSDVEGEPMLVLNRISNASKLPSAQYFVKISAVNGLDQEGAWTERKPLHFASQSLKTKKKSSSSKKSKKS